jgi:hypothetical protein
MKMARYAVQIKTTLREATQTNEKSDSAALNFR